jgi:hypothetical protein
MPEVLRSLEELLEDQDLVIARTQALRYFTSSALGRRIGRGGRWQILLPTVYGAFTGHPTEQQRLRAAVLYVGPGAFITAATGCRLYGLRGAPKCQHVHVASTSRQASSVGFAVVERTIRPTRTRQLRGLPVAVLPRCVVDATLPMTDLDAVRALIAEPARRRMLRPDDLAAELSSAPRNGSRLARQALHEILAGARSAAECKQIRILSRSAVLPALHYNCSVIGPNGWIADPDAYCEESGVAQEIDSVEFHIEPAAWKSTMARRSRMVANGVRVLEAPPSRLDRDEAGVRREFEQAHLIGLRSGPPPGVWVRCRPDCPLRGRVRDIVVVSLGPV